jgi:acetyltransferase-like isoleucine patch superfamily enzyme
MFLYVLVPILLIFILVFLLKSKEGFGFDSNLTDILPITISEDNSTISVPNFIQGYSGTDLNFGGGLELNDINTFEFGKGITKESDAGKIGYQFLSKDSLDIVGAGEVKGERKVHIYDALSVENSMNVTNGLTLGSSMNSNTLNTNELTVNGTSSVGQSVEVGQNVTVGGNVQVNGTLLIGNEWEINQQGDNLLITNSTTETSVSVMSNGDVYLPYLNNTIGQSINQLYVPPPSCNSCCDDGGGGSDCTIS